MMMVVVVVVVMMMVLAMGNTVPACRALLLIGGMHACHPC